jgi:hypothetical protein
MEHLRVRASSIRESTTALKFVRVWPLYVQLCFAQCRVTRKIRQVFRVNRFRTCSNNFRSSERTSMMTVTCSGSTLGGSAGYGFSRVQ